MANTTPPPPPPLSLDCTPDGFCSLHIFVKMAIGTVLLTPFLTPIYSFIHLLFSLFSPHAELYKFCCTTCVPSSHACRPFPLLVCSIRSTNNSNSYVKKYVQFQSTCQNGTEREMNLKPVMRCISVGRSSHLHSCVHISRSIYPVLNHG